MAVLASQKTRLMLAMGAVKYYYPDGENAILAPLRTSNGGAGIIFPFQPDVVYSQSVNYNSYDLPQTNYSFHAYRNTASPTIQLTAQFASTTIEEGRYTLATIHFLRSVTKMWYGIGDNIGGTPKAGTPPPVLRFSSFGTNQFNNIPVIIGNVSTTYDSSVDLKDIDGTAVPVVMAFSLDLMVQQSPARQKNVFSKRSFISGAAYQDGFI